MATFRTGLREREFTEARMKTRSSWIAALFAAAIVIVSAACSSASGAVPAAAGPVPEEPDITVAAIPAVDLAGLYIAQDRGLFARQGLHVRIEPIPSAQSVIADQLNGKVDISAGSYVAYIAAEAAGARFRDEVLADLDQGAVTNLPVDGYVSTLAWARQHPKTAAAFTLAIEQGQKIANHDVSAVQAIMAQNDKLPPQVTASMALPATYPVGPVVAANIQRVAVVMLQFGVLGRQYATQVRQGTVVRSMIASG